jgi:hypothetical protein
MACGSQLWPGRATKRIWSRPSRSRSLLRLRAAKKCRLPMKMWGIISRWTFAMRADKRQGEAVEGFLILFLSRRYLFSSWPYVFLFSDLLIDSIQALPSYSLLCESLFRPRLSTHAASKASQSVRPEKLWGFDLTKYDGNFKRATSAFFQSWAQSPRQRSHTTW